MIALHVLVIYYLITKVLSHIQHTNTVLLYGMDYGRMSTMPIINFNNNNNKVAQIELMQNHTHT